MVAIEYEAVIWACSFVGFFALLGLSFYIFCKCVDKGWCHRRKKKRTPDEEQAISDPESANKKPSDSASQSSKGSQKTLKNPPPPYSPTDAQAEGIDTADPGTASTPPTEPSPALKEIQEETDKRIAAARLAQARKNLGLTMA